ncbi:hypothetical protein LQ567_21635 [Niabella pedocola]|uniref:Uncharacterized protein n=1 Tax=Niabella pedocola TaxID=1752077 RepID=A0ABS8PWE5_9BACT|nr:hypothetical protein [Niabella pedocola]MCD2425401.1 hypothetical protein [Niabella pedocola]
MKRFNIFNSNNPLFHYRWFILVILACVAAMAWYDYQGTRMFGGSNNNSNSYGSSRTGIYHK